MKPLPCTKKIEIEGTNGVAVTYCYRPIGHEGKCSAAPVKDDFDKGLPSAEDLDKTEEENHIKELTKEERILKDYGPYKSDDPRSHRGF